MIRPVFSPTRTAAFLLIVNLLFATHAAGQTDLTPLPLQEIKTFAKVFETIKNNYVEDVSDEELLNSAIRGMISGLDPHSTLLSGQDMSQIRIDTTGQYGGLGIEIVKEDGGIRVISPIDDTPAHKAGIQPGDLIVRIDKRPINRLDLNAAVNKMRGPPGTDVDLTIIRRGSPQPIEITLTRAVIRIRSVRGFTLEPNFGYIRITQFQSSTPDLARGKIEELLEENEYLDGLVLDLRNNPGGELRSAIGISNLFIDQGVIVTTRNRNGTSSEDFRATAGDILNDIPIVALVNEGSASASEIVAGALQDHGRAVIMGKQTFGKGSVQTIMSVDKLTAIKLTTHRYYTPKDRSIQGEGITPDIVVERRELNDVDEQESDVLRESDLDGALENENAAQEDETVNSLVHPSVARDYQLQQALNLLKGLRIGRALQG